MWIVALSVAHGFDIVPDPDDFDIDLGGGDETCTVQDKCEGRPGRTCIADDGACNLAAGWTKKCDNLGTSVYCWEGVGKPIDRCGNLMALEVRAGMGQLDAGEVQCLDNMAADSMALERRRASDILLEHTWTADKEAWEKAAARHVQHIGDDADVYYKLTEINAAKDDPSPAVPWAAEALKRASTWPDAKRPEKVLALHGMRTNAAITAWKAETAAQKAAGSALDPNESPLAKQSRDFAKAWVAACTELGQPKTDALKACVAAGATKDWCSSP